MARFHKLVGAGNDFIFLTDKECPAHLPGAELARRLCDRVWGVGADGLVILKGLTNQDLKWEFFNRDGSVAEMCGNAARCAVLYCDRILGIPRPKIATQIGQLTGEAKGKDRYSVRWQLPTSKATEVSVRLPGDRSIKGLSINSGVPHFVIVDGEELSKKDCELLQKDPIFAPAQTNVTLVNPTAKPWPTTRTFERGVRDFTLACGTGVIASAILLRKLSGGDQHHLQAPGGLLEVKLNDPDVELIGPAEILFSGEIELTGASHV